MATPEIPFEDKTPTWPLDEDHIIDTTNLQTYNYAAQTNRTNRDNYNRAYKNQEINMTSGQVVPAERRQLLVPEEAVGVSEPDEKTGLTHQINLGVTVVEQKPLPFYAAGPKPVLEPDVTDITGPYSNDPAHYIVGPNDTREIGFETDYTNKDGSVVRLIKISWAGFKAKYEVVRKVS